MQATSLRQLLAAWARGAWRVLDWVVSALVVDTTEYPEEYDWARELPW